MAASDVYKRQQCLTIADITTTYQIGNQNIALDDITNKGTGNNEQCRDCHDQGLNGLLMAVDDTVMLRILQEAPEGLWRDENVNGTVTAVPAFEKLRRFGDGVAQNQQAGIPAVTHPRYNNIYPGQPDGDPNNIDPYMQVLQNVTDAVVARQVAGQCIVQ